MVHSLQCTDDMICDHLSTCPAKLQAGLVAVCTQWDSCFIVVLFTSQWNVTRSTLETTVMVRPVQGLDCWFRQCHRFTAEATHIFILLACVLDIFVFRLGQYVLIVPSGG